VERVKGDAEDVALRRLEVALESRDDRLVRRRVEVDRREVQDPFVLEYPHLGAVGRRHPGVRELLHEVREHRGAAPGGLVEPAVEHDRALGADGDRGGARGGHGVHPATDAGGRRAPLGGRSLAARERPDRDSDHQQEGHGSVAHERGGRYRRSAPAVADVVRQGGRRHEGTGEGASKSRRRRTGDWDKAAS